VLGHGATDGSPVRDRQRDACGEVNATLAVTNLQEPPMSQLPKTFAHHRLDAYQVALEAMTEVVALTRLIPRGHRSIADQMKRSSTSVVANIAEGANRHSPGEKRQKYTIARAEAGETAAWLEILVGLGLATEAQVAPTAHRLDRVAAMLTRLIRRHPA
jgi:four helix bundle protein